jgi:hypothetical protein
MFSCQANAALLNELADGSRQVVMAEPRFDAQARPIDSTLSCHAGRNKRDRIVDSFRQTL